MSAVAQGKVSAERLPPLPGYSGAYVVGLLLLALAFYLLVILSILAIVATGVVVIWLVGSVLIALRDMGVTIMYVSAMSAFGMAFLLALMMQGILARVGGGMVGILCGRGEYRALYALTDEVARKIGSPPIERIYLVPGMDVGVQEEGAIWKPPGMGTRTLVLGMGALDRLTVEQLRAILAHEYGHFAARDTAVSRFIGRARTGFYEIILAIQVGGRGWHLINPLYWMLHGYGHLFGLAAAKHGRLREFYADRYAVEAYGPKPLQDALIATGIESEFFSAYFIDDLMRYSRSRLFPGNVYRDISQSRLLAVVDNGEQAFYAMLVNLLMKKVGKFDDHPTLAERMRMQGISIEDLELPGAPRVAPSREDRQVPPEEMEVYRAGPQSAAETLFGAGLPKVQATLSGLMADDFRQKLSQAKTLQNLGV